MVELLQNKPTLFGQTVTRQGVVPDDDDGREEESFRNKEALELLEKTRGDTTLRSPSDPCPEEGFLKDTKSTTGDDGGDEGLDFHQKLTLVACEEEKSLEDFYAGIEKGKLGHPGDKGSDAKEESSSSSLSLVRAPYLPPDICRSRKTTRVFVFQEGTCQGGSSLSIWGLPNILQRMLQSISVRSYRSDRYLDWIKSGKSSSHL